MKRAVICTVMLSLATPALAQSGGYGIRTMPLPKPRPAPKVKPGYEGAYDRADGAWRDERQSCLYGRGSSSSTRRACDYTMRNRQPLSSDFLKKPAAK